MIAPGCLYVAVLLSIDGEQLVGDQGYYFDMQDQQKYFAQGKYSMGSSLFPIHFNSLNSCCMCHLDRDSLELSFYLVPTGYALCSFASAQLNHDLVT
jgi:hypothetical protein